MCMISGKKSLFIKLYNLPKDLSLSKLKLELGYPHCETPEELEGVQQPARCSKRRADSLSLSTDLARRLCRKGREVRRPNEA